MRTKDNRPAPNALDGRGARVFEVDGERVDVRPSKANINRSTHAVQRARYTRAEADRRKSEARRRIERQRERQQAARYFRRLEVVRRV